LLGVVVALAGPAVFGVLTAPGGIELNAKKMALAFGIGALIFWAVVSYFSGAGALGAFLAFGALIYCWLWIPNRTTNFLNDVPGVTNGMIDGSKQYTLNGVVPILAVISLVYAIQLITRGVQRRRRERADDERLQREQEAAQAQQEADVAAVYPVAGSTYQAPPPYESHSQYDDLFDEPEPQPVAEQPVQPRNQADEQTAQFPIREAGTAEAEQTALFPQEDVQSNEAGDEHGHEGGDETVIAPAPAAEVQEPEAPAAKQPPAAEETQPVEETRPVEETQPAQEAQPVAEEPQPVAEATPVQESQPVEETKAVGETKPVPVVQPEKKVTPKEEMGSQYRERMEDPEDTGEFHMAFENPVVKPA
jgi:hypothetical protein